MTSFDTSVYHKWRYGLTTRGFRFFQESPGRDHHTQSLCSGLNIHISSRPEIWQATQLRKERDGFLVVVEWSGPDQDQDSPDQLVQVRDTNLEWTWQISKCEEATRPVALSGELVWSTGILVVLLFLNAPSSRYQSRGWLMPIYGHVGLSSSFGIPPHSWCAIIEYLCKLNALQVLYHVTSRDKDTSKKQTWRKSLRRDEERAMVITFKVILNVVLLPLQCICCHFHLLQSRWKGMVSVSWLDRPISLKFN